MDIAIIATGAVTLLAPYVRKAAEEYAGAAGQAVWEATQRLYRRLRSALTPDPAAADAMARFERAPEAEQEAFVRVLAARLAADPDLADQVAESIAAAKRAGATVHVIQRVVEAERVVGAEVGRIRGDRSLRVDQQVERGKDVLGVRIDEL
nr:hypothetical protein GCM10020063_097700 [Dactylosporangium thailandense]